MADLERGIASFPYIFKLTRKPKGLWHSCQRGSHPSELNYSQIVHSPIVQIPDVQC